MRLSACAFSGGKKTFHQWRSESIFISPVPLIDVPQLVILLMTSFFAWAHTFAVGHVNVCTMLTPTHRMCLWGSPGGTHQQRSLASSTAQRVQPWTLSTAINGALFHCFSPASLSLSLALFLLPSFPLCLWMTSSMYPCRAAYELCTSSNLYMDVCFWHHMFWSGLRNSQIDTDIQNIQKRSDKSPYQGCTHQVCVSFVLFPVSTFACSLMCERLKINCSSVWCGCVELTLGDVQTRHQEVTVAAVGNNPALFQSVLHTQWIWALVCARYICFVVQKASWHFQLHDGWSVKILGRSWRCNHELQLYSQNHQSDNSTNNSKLTNESSFNFRFWTNSLSAVDVCSWVSGWQREKWLPGRQENPRIICPRMEWAVLPLRRFRMFV